MRMFNLVRPVPLIRERLARAARACNLARSRLGVRFFTIVVATVLLGTALSFLFTLFSQHRQIVEDAHSASQHTGIAIQASLRHAMLSNDFVMLGQMVNAISGDGGLDRVTILDMDGRTWLGSSPSGTGRPSKQPISFCRVCHTQEPGPFRLASASSSAVMGDAMITVRPIPNEPACYACHGSGSRPLGMLLLETPLAGIEAQLSAGFWQNIFSSLVLFILLVGLLMPALVRFVLQPVLALAQCARALGAGDLDFPAPSHRGDELGELAVAFDTMRRDLKLALVEKERRNHQLQTLNEISRKASRLLDPQQILDLTVNLAVKNLGVQAGAIYLLDRHGERFSQHACYGMSGCEQMACCLWGFNRRLAGLSGSDGKDVASVRTGPYGFERVWQSPEGCSYIGIPLRARGKLLGAMAFITYPHRQVTQENPPLLREIGDAVGMALANAIEFQDVRTSATLEERERLAREMHDSLAQALGYLKMQASQADDLLSSGLVAQAQANMRAVKEIAGETYFDVREAIFGLRHLAPPEADFVPALKEYLSEYHTHYGVNVRLRLDESHPPAFPAEVNIQLTRIIQEALTNVRKHARIQQATLCFEREELHWRVTVEDKGQGFDLGRVPRAGQAFVGLSIMRERAVGIGATFQVESRPGHGTTVMLRIPLANEYHHDPTIAYSPRR